MQTHWSSVYRFDTDHGYCYLKQVPPGLSLEPQVIHWLQKTGKASVPLFIAENPDLHCFLMQDAGIPLRAYFKKGFDANILLDVMHHYMDVQRTSIAYQASLLAMGISDWRLEKIPVYYEKLIQEEELLRADGLTKNELIKLSALTPTLVSICEQLSQCNIPPTFNHDDFHDNNVLIHPATHKTTLVDLGEVSITHPFFSLFNMLYHVKTTCALKEDVYQYLQQQVLKPWLAYASQDQLLTASALIQRSGPLHRVFTEYRLLTSVEKQTAQQLLGQGRFLKNLKAWLNEPS